MRFYVMARLFGLRHRKFSTHIPTPWYRIPNRCSHELSNVTRSFICFEAPIFD
jgi:hypothetical protein